MTLWIGLEYFALGPASYFRMHDDGDSVVARNIIMMNDLKAQGQSFWYPHTGCGHDRFSTDMRYTYLPVALNYFLPAWVAYQATVLLIFFFCVYFTYRFAVDIMQLAPVAGVFAGFSFALYFEEITTYFGYCIFPFMLWSLERADELSGVKRYSAIALIAMVFAIGSSFIYTQPVTLSLVLLWFFLVRRKFSLKFLLMLGIVFTAIFFFQDVPAMITAVKTHYPISHKAGYTTGQATDNYIQYIFLKYLPMPASNLPAFLLGIVGLFAIKKKKLETWFIFIFALLCTVGAGLFQLSVYLLGESDIHVPSVILSSGYMVGRYAQVAHFFLGLCGAFGIDYLVKRARAGESFSGFLQKHPPARVLKIALIVAFGLLFAKSIHKKAVHFGEWNQFSFYSRYYDRTTVAELGKMRRESGELFRVSTFGETAGITAQYGLEDVGGIIVFYSQRYKSFWSKVLEPLALRDHFVDRYFNHYGNRIYLFRPRIDNIQDSDIIEFRKYYNLNLLSLANVKYIITRVRMRDDSLDMLPHDWKAWHEIDNRVERITTRIREVNFQGKNRDYIYENSDVFPRYFTVGSVKYFETGAELFDALGKADFTTLKTSVFMEEEYRNIFPENQDSASPFGNNITVKVYSNDRIVLDATAPSASILVASNTYSPYWKCMVDGEETPIAPAYGVFWGVPLKEGAHTVEFLYEPPYRDSIRLN